MTYPYTIYTWDKFILKCTYSFSLTSFGPEMNKYGMCMTNAIVINMLKTILALYTVHTTDLCNGYRTAINRSDVNNTTSHTLIKLQI